MALRPIAEHRYHTEVGSCRIIFGPMFSGKSTTLRDEITTLADIGLKVVYINHAKDVRTTEAQDQHITTHHSGFKGLSSKVNVIKVEHLKDVNPDEYDGYAIDEGNFFDDLDVVVRDLVLNKGKIVIIASLDGDYLMNPFGKAHNLISICEPGDIIKLSAICVKCMEKSLAQNGRVSRVPAGFTAKLVINKPILEGKDESPIDVGGSDKYAPVCMKCHREHMESIMPVVPKESMQIVSSIDLDSLDAHHEKTSYLDRYLEARNLEYVQNLDLAVPGSPVVSIF